MSLKQTNHNRLIIARFFAPNRPISACPPNHRPAAIGRNRQMKISNRQITMIRGAANPVEFNGIGARARNAEQVFAKGDSSRVWRDRFRASGIRRVKAGTFINNFIPDKGIERMGTGIRDMIRRCRTSGLAEPEIRLDGVFFVLTIRRKKSGSGAQSGAQSEAILKNLGKEPLSAAELAVVLGLQSKTGAFKRTLQELVDSGMIEYTIPDEPTSRLQKYRLTEKVRRLLEQLDEKVVLK